jgi:cell division protein FtsB
MSTQVVRPLFTKAAFLRTRRRPRVARIRVGAVRFLLALLILSAIVLGITWKNVEFKRTNLTLAQSRTTLTALMKEQRQLSGEIKALTSYPQISAWAKRENSWQIAAHPPGKIVIPRKELTPSAQLRWDILRVRDE